MIKILITGASGQLGRCLVDRLDAIQGIIEYDAVDHSSFNISDINQVEKFVGSGEYDYVVNCAAYTNVNKALADEKDAILANGYGPKLLAEACERTRTKLIHISTDYVFDGSPEEKTETATPHPLNTYGRTKLLGENEILAVAEHSDLEYMIIRTSWVYSEYGNNFVKTILNKMMNSEEIKVVDDQYGSPTYAGDLADFIISVIMREVEAKEFVSGIFNYSNLGIISWYDFAYGIYQFYREYLTHKGILATPWIEPCKTSDFPSPVERPKFGILPKEKVINTLETTVNHWTVPLKFVVEKLIDLKKITATSV